MNYQLYEQDCLEWMNLQPEGSVDCIITSPPYNLDIHYGTYKDDLPRDSYLKWMLDVAKASKRILSSKGHLFLNVGYSNVDPWVAMDVANVFRKEFMLQNQFIWVKHILVNEQSYGIYKPILSDRFSSLTTENIYHFTKSGDVPVDRLSIGHRNKAEGHKYPELYSEARYIANMRRKIARKMKFKNWTDLKKRGSKEQLDKFEEELKNILEKRPFDVDKKKCIGNAWYIPYTPTSKLSKEMMVIGDTGSREKSRGNHPATFPEMLPTMCIKFSGIKKDSIVYDPFVGTGTTVLAAMKLGMVGIGTDIDKEYLAFAKDRLDITISKFKNYSLESLFQ